MMQLLIDALNRIPEFQQLLSALEGGRSPAALSGVAAAPPGSHGRGDWDDDRAARGSGVRRRRGGGTAGPGSGCLRRSGGAGSYPALLYLPQCRHRLPPVGAPEAGPDGEAGRGAASLPGSHGGRACSSAPFRHSAGAVLLPTESRPRAQDLAQLAEALSAAGYIRCDQVEGVGQFALRGGILDVYAPGMDAPARVEFFGDEVDAMGSFDLSTQRRTENLEEVRLLPAAETLPQLAPRGTGRVVGAAPPTGG